MCTVRVDRFVELSKALNEADAALAEGKSMQESVEWREAGLCEPGISAWTWGSLM